MYTLHTGNRSEWTDTLIVLPFKAKPINTSRNDIPNANPTINKEKNEKAGVHLPSFNNVPPQKEQKETASTSYTHIFETPEQYRMDATIKQKSPDNLPAASSSSDSSPNRRGSSDTTHSNNGSYSSRGKDAPYQYPSYIHSANSDADNNNGSNNGSYSSRGNVDSNNGSYSSRGNVDNSNGDVKINASRPGSASVSQFEYPTYIYKTRTSTPAPASVAAAQPATGKTTGTGSGTAPQATEKTSRTPTPTENVTPPQVAEKVSRTPTSTEKAETEKTSHTPPLSDNTIPVIDKTHTSSPSLFSSAPSASVKTQPAAESTEYKSNYSTAPSSGDSIDILPSLFVPDTTSNTTNGPSRKSSIFESTGILIRNFFVVILLNLFDPLYFIFICNYISLITCLIIIKSDFSFIIHSWIQVVLPLLMFTVLLLVMFQVGGIYICIHILGDKCSSCMKDFFIFPDKLALF
jgi:hypothetical protein